MGTRFWVKRFLNILVAAVVLLAAVHYVKGYALRESIRFGLLWGVLCAAIFTAARIYQSRRKQHCALCRDTPEMNPALSDPDRR